ncbi:MAG: hypothetical protein JRF72_23160 [Deltaproteobacteria bacterium]|jgi:hypothetical protein|nr:hypothetical protein [Deltaproteobacteria bacterium]
MRKSELRNIVSVSWSDHLIFGEGDGRLSTVQALARRMEKWREELNAAIIHWRCTRDRIRGRFYAGRGFQHFFKACRPDIDWDDFRVVPEMAHKCGMQVFLYVTLFDEGWPLLPKRVREVSYHNRMHCQHVSWQSEFSRRHPQYAVADRKLRKHQWGVMCLGFPQVRQHMIRRHLGLLQKGNFDGLFVCLRSQSKPADHADQYGFNDPIHKEYLERYRIDIRTEKFDLQRWRDLLGEYLTCFLRELRKALTQEQVRLAIGTPRGSILGPPVGNTALQWQTWVREGIIDQLVIDQNSSRCPSMWHELWPMHRGYGYIQNYLTGRGMNLHEEDVVKTYAPVFNGRSAKLYLARQWQERSELKEKELLKLPGIEGFVFSSFRHDNPGPIRRNNWTA